jgi:8-oxo-dGTP diphosphatase
MEFPHGLKRTAAMVILQHEQAFLLLQRAKSPNRGLYVPVGGKVDPYEAPAAAARREAEEETGIRLRPEQLRFCGILIEISPTAYNWTCHIYWAQVPRLQPPPFEEGELHWISFEELDQLPTPPTDWWVYQYVRREQPFVFSALYDENLQILSMEEEIGGRALKTGGGFARP